MEKIDKLKQAFKREKIDGYIIPKNDEFFSEYIPNYNDRLNYISNFSGSYGFSLVMKNTNYLFVDGRYTLQAIKQSGNFFQVKTFPKEMPKDILKNKKFIIGYDPKLITSRTLNILFAQKNCVFKALEDNLIDKFWKRKIKEKISKFYKLPNNSVGNNYKVKINKIVNYLKKGKADFQFISASENNAWLLNIRGRDTEYAPIPYSYVLIDKFKNVKFFCNLKKITSSLKKQLKGIDFVDIKLISKTLSKIKKKNLL